MRGTDPIYGQFDITEPVVVELIESPTVQRMKRLNQYGPPDRYYPRKNFSRYDHSLGVLLLLRVLGAGLEEQIAGLLHDVSHTAFSHVYDWAIIDHSTPGQNEDQQDLRHEAFVKRSELPGILERHGVDPSIAWDYKRFGLLERDLPALCADRVDYSLRELGQARATPHLDGLSARDGRIVFTSATRAQAFADDYLRLQEEHWASYEAIARYYYLAQILRWGLEAGLITMEDFETDDETMLAKLEQSSHPLILAGFKVMAQPTLPWKPTSNVMHKKFRHVDPHVRTVDGLKPLSKLRPEFAQRLAHSRRLNQRGHAIPPLAELL